MNSRSIRPAGGALDVELNAPPSKSVTHRALVSAALADTRSTLRGPLVADDTLFTRDALAALGVPIESESGSWVVHGRAGVIQGGAELFLGDSGTSLRFLTAVTALSSRPSRIDGSARLRERPIAELAAALNGIGGRVQLAPGGRLPLEVGGSRLSGGFVRVPSGRSSQFASALLLIAPRIPGGLDLQLLPPAVSLPYIELTVDLLTKFGVAVDCPEPLRWRVAPGGYPGRKLTIEGDHSTASYFLAAAAVAGGRVRVTRLNPGSAQADSRLGGILSGLGCTVDRGEDWVEVRAPGRVPPFDLEMSDLPDLVPTLAVLGLFADGPCTVRGVAHLRHKESDRLEILARNLSGLGRPSEVAGDRLEIGSREGTLRGGRIQTASDHRIAMAFAVAGLRIPGIRIDDAGCVAKSDPGFWKRFENLVGA
jgi:3-phosphoshikimate 1-carboxyvinyltransferase